MGFIFSKPVPFEPSIKIKKGWAFMFSSRSFFKAGAIAKLNMHVAFVDAEWYLTAIFESGKMLLSVGDNWSLEANGTFQLVVKTATHISASVLFVASSDAARDEFWLWLKCFCSFLMLLHAILIRSCFPMWSHVITLSHVLHQNLRAYIIYYEII